MQIVNIYFAEKNAKFCITKNVIFSFIYFMIQGGGVTKMLILAHIGGGGGSRRGQIWLT